MKRSIDSPSSDFLPVYSLYSVAKRKGHLFRFASRRGYQDIPWQEERGNDSCRPSVVLAFGCDTKPNASSGASTAMWFGCRMQSKYTVNSRIFTLMVDNAPIGPMLQKQGFTTKQKLWKRADAVMDYLITQDMKPEIALLFERPNSPNLASVGVSTDGANIELG